MKETVKDTEYPEKWTKSHFFQLTDKMFDAVATHDFTALQKLCDDDFGIVDINPEGGSEIIRNTEGWEEWFKGLFEKMAAMNAETWSIITDYNELVADKLAYAVVDFDQYFIHEGKTLKFGVLATIIWKKTDKDKWIESRYHSSLKQVEELS